jgi:hypothetical protein
VVSHDDIHCFSFRLRIPYLLLSAIAGELLAGSEKDGQLGAIRANARIWISEQPWAMYLEQSVHDIMRSGNALTLPFSGSLPLRAIIVPSSLS